MIGKKGNQNGIKGNHIGIKTMDSGIHPCKRRHLNIVIGVVLLLPVFVGVVTEGSCRRGMSFRGSCTALDGTKVRQGELSVLGTVGDSLPIIMGVVKEDSSDAGARMSSCSC